MSSYDIYLRRLLADGEGTGELRRFELVLSYIKNMRVNGSTAAEASKGLRMIEAMELSVKKQCYVDECCSRQIAEYAVTTTEIEKELLASKELMEQAKNDLAAARQVRRNRQEYAVMVRQIDEAPTRDDTIQKLAEIQEDLKNQHERQRLLELKLAERKEKCSAINTLLENFQAFIKKDDEQLFTDRNGIEEAIDTEYSPGDT